MATTSSSQFELDLEQIDDILYLIRVNEADELQQTLGSLAEQYKCTVGDVLTRCIDPQSGNSGLHYSAANGFNDVTVSILQATQLPVHDVAATSASFVDHQNQQGNTALHWASLNGHLEIVKQLVSAGANMWLKNTAGHLAMFEAERAEKSEVVQYLLQAGGKEVEQTGTEAEEDGDVLQSEATVNSG